MNMDYKNIIAARLKSLRVAGKYTQNELARILDTSQQNIQLWESQKRTPTIEVLVAYCTYFNIKPSSLIDILLPQNIGEISIENIVDNFKAELLSVLPDRLPIYSQRVFGNPKYPTQQPHDYIYWSKKRVNGRRLYLIQVQTPNMYPDIKTNDRIIVDPDLPMSDGAAVIIHNQKRANFDNQLGASVVRIRSNASGKFEWTNNFSNKSRLLKDSEFQGMVIQVITAFQVEGIYPSYDHIEEHHSATKRGVNK
tara:strand:+ start:1110 stop:1865 length:756 start_codon:yes stop_codon:yes gene_type:complete